MMTGIDDVTNRAPAEAGAPAPFEPFEKPGPGSWKCEGQHCDRPMARYQHEIHADGFLRGFREAMADYGSLLEGFEMAFINGFPYARAIPVGAPPEAKGPPPKLIFKLATRLHPELRRRIRRSAETFELQRWREDARRYRDESVPEIRAQLIELQRTPLAALSLDDLIDHLERCFALAKHTLYRHHGTVCAVSLPTGDLLAHTVRWTGASPAQVLRILKGASPGSRFGDEQLDRLVAAIQAAPGMSELVRAKPPAQVIETLLADDSNIGELARDWIDHVGYSIIGLFCISGTTGLETPELLVEPLRKRLEEGPMPESNDDGGLATLRARVPAEHRAQFDALFTEARDVYFIRDLRAMTSLWAVGVCRRAVLEAGRRLHERGRIHAPDHALEFEHAELLAALRDAAAPSADELAAYVAYRLHTRLDDVPENLGPAPSPPPPSEWLPGPAARLAAAFGAYLSAMFDDAQEESDDTAVRGLGVSPGKQTGRARLVLEPGDFTKIEEGDILVARMTTPTYNVLLPILGGIVTDRGGLLSHPAIVSREYGIPGVVGCRDATKLIPDGAMVELDGDAGTVRVIG